VLKASHKPQPPTKTPIQIQLLLFSSAQSVHKFCTMQEENQRLTSRSLNRSRPNRSRYNRLQTPLHSSTSTRRLGLPPDPFGISQKLLKAFDIDVMLHLVSAPIATDDVVLALSADLTFPCFLVCFTTFRAVSPSSSRTPLTALGVSFGSLATLPLDLPGLRA